MKTNALPNGQIAQQAAEWAVLIDGGSLTSGERIMLADWLTTSPVHVDELVLSCALMTGLGLVDSEGAISTRELLERSAPEVVPLFDAFRNPDSAETLNDGVVPSHHPSPSRNVLTRRPFAVAASVALALVAGLAFFATSPFPPQGIAEGNQIAQAFVEQDPNLYATAVGEQRSIALEDGSIVYMNTNSEMRATISSEGRRIDLLRGEAMFEVAHDPDRPFRVYAGDAIAQAVGTKFNVQYTSKGINVVVVEGRVLVKNQASPAIVRKAKATNARSNNSDQKIATFDAKPVMLIAGDQAQLGVALVPPQVTPANIAAITSWQMRQLLFEQEGLDSIAQEFNRYNKTKIVLADASIAKMSFSGMFSADDPDSFIDFLELSTGVEVDRSEDGKFVLKAAQSR